MCGSSSSVPMLASGTDVAVTAPPNTSMNRSTLTT
eukprot:CAMPEP_0180809788 /NCGR_PEP_ID=MMETSP1038_2-20121128/64513_1 /TAXON_ID=632150 /ORGANISM="Azadinium spinosum, Strain 3D9" /LENGTH=34 /DNA_ID= /DNA_START= /DNA_END= /DNA_ORIENTATION=